MEVRSVEAIVSALNKAEAKYLIVGGLAVKTLEPIKADWKWGSPEGSRELDRLLDRQLTFCE